MTDSFSPQLPPIPSRNPLRNGRWKRYLLPVSLAINLGVAGVIGGAMVGGHGPGHHQPMLRDIGFGQFSEAMTRPQRDALRDAFVRRTPGLGADLLQMRAESGAILLALRGDPFVPSDLGKAIQAQNARLEQRLQVGQTLFEDFIVSMTAEDRLAFADRLQERMEHDVGQDREGD